MVNALWLRASWLKPFEPGGTRPQRFAAPGGDVDVPTMRVTRQLPYVARDGWTVVSVPAGEGVVADVLLPDGDLASAEAGLDADRLDGLLAAGSPTEVALELPRVRVRGQASLAEPLARLGVRTAVHAGRRPVRGDRRRRGADGGRGRAQGGADRWTRPAWRAPPRPPS